ncbi:MAG: PEP-CTERM sorting domain-containing protein [Planctomycetota bacterium]
MRFRYFPLLVALAVGLAFPSTICAAPVTLMLSGTLSGSLDGNAFTDEQYVFDVVFDTTDVVPFSDGFEVLASSSTFEFSDLQGGTTASVTTPVLAFVNNTFGTLGFGNDSIGVDFIVLGDPSFQAYDLGTTLGAVSPTFADYFEVATPLQTSAGDLIFTDAFGATNTNFAAVPEPGSGVLAGLGLIAASLGRRRKKRS